MCVTGSIRGIVDIHNHVGNNGLFTFELTVGTCGEQWLLVFVGSWRWGPVGGTGVIITPSVVSLQFDRRSSIIDSTTGIGISEGS